MSHEFQLVTSKRKGRKIRPFDSHFTPASVSTSKTKEEIQRKVKAALADFKSSSFCKELFSALSIGLTNPLKVDILCLGLGQFSANFTERSACYQLAALLAIQEKFGAKGQVYDPLFNPVEVSVLADYDLDIIKVNEEGKHVVKTDRKTIVYLPHCSKHLTNNFLWANWGPQLSDCVLISNSFSRLMSSNTAAEIEKAAGFIKRIFPFTDEVELRITHSDYYNSFNDLSVHCFSSGKLKDIDFQERTEPVYSQGLDFITKETVIRIENVQGCDEGVEEFDV